MFDGSRVGVNGPGTLYVAALATTEPTSVTGSWPSGWTQLGYTDNGSEFNVAPKFAAVEVEEEIDPIAQVPTGRDITLAFSMAELTAQNYVVALNGGLSPSAAVKGTNSDGSIWIEPPAYGSESYMMLGWDAIGEGQAQGNVLGRFVVRKAIQTGTIKIDRRKGNTKALYSCTFSAVKPAGVQPFRHILPANMAA